MYDRVSGRVQGVYYRESCRVEATRLRQRVLGGGKKELDAYLGFLKAGCSKDPLDLLRDAGVDVQSVRQVTGPTGMAVVAVEASGENLIMVSPGANSLASADLDALRDVGAVLMQHEIPEPALVAAARACTGLVVLNAAPVRRR